MEQVKQIQSKRKSRCRDGVPAVASRQETGLRPDHFEKGESQETLGAAKEIVGVR
jgi:hypothetical protein